MPKPQTRGRTRHKGVVIATVLLVVVALGLLTVRLGWPGTLTRVFAGESKQEQDHAGKVAVLISPAPLSAFTALDPATFIDPNTQDFYVRWIAEKAANDAGFIRDPSLIRGRVLQRDKGAGLAFSEADFFPKGSRASLTSAIEPGFRGVNLNAAEIDGLRALKRFDRFDLYAVKARSNAPGANTNAYTPPEMIEAAQAATEWQTDRLVIAQNAKILEPISQARGAKNPDDVYVVIRDEEASALADARAKGAKIFCLGRSGLPGGDATALEQPADPHPVDTIQMLNGDKSSTTYVPSAKPADSTPKVKDDPK